MAIQFINSKEKSDLLNVRERLAEISSKSGQAYNKKYYLEYINLRSLFFSGTLTIMLIFHSKHNSILNKKPYSIKKAFKVLSEVNDKEIYRMAFVSGLITEKTHKLLKTFYEKRNALIHRYVFGKKSYNSLVNKGEIDLVDAILDSLNEDFDSLVKLIGNGKLDFLYTWVNKQTQ